MSAASRRHVVPGAGLEPACPLSGAADFKSAASADFAIRATPGLCRRTTVSLWSKVDTWTNQTRAEQGRTTMRRADRDQACAKAHARVPPARNALAEPRRSDGPNRDRSNAWFGRWLKQRCPNVKAPGADSCGLPARINPTAPRPASSALWSPVLSARLIANIGSASLPERQVPRWLCRRSGAT